MTQRFLVYVLVGGVCGFGSVFLEYPGIFLALLVLIILAATVRKPADLLRVGAYLVGAGIVGLSIIGPAVRPGPGGMTAGRVTGSRASPRTSSAW